jgi:predicted transcriptional regulator
MVEEERNKKIVALVDEGKAQKEVAEVVGVNPATVSRVMQKRNNSELATDGSWLNKRPAIEPVVKPTEIDPLKITSSDADTPKVDERLERKVAKRVEQALKAERKALDREYQKRINDAVETFLTTRIAPVYGKRLELAEEIIKAYEKPIMTKAQYRKILSCLHPDFAVDEDTKKKLDGVFHMFKQFESILVQAKSINLEPIAETVQQFIDSKKAA